MANKLPPFKGKPLIEIPTFIPSANFLVRDFGKAVYDEYLGRTEKDYHNSPVLKVLSYENDIVKGSNPFAVALVGKIVGQEGLRVATQADIERELKRNALPLREQYDDTGLVLRNEDEPNSYLAKNLMAQIRERSPKAKMPAMIPLSELELVADEDSPYKLGFNIKENAQIFYDLFVLNKDGNFSSEDIDEKTGLPIKTGKGNRTLYVRESGVSGLGLGWGLGLYSGTGTLPYSNNNGRVVVVSPKGTSD